MTQNGKIHKTGAPYNQTNHQWSGKMSSANLQTGCTELSEPLETRLQSLLLEYDSTLRALTLTEVCLIIHRELDWS